MLLMMLSNSMRRDTAIGVFILQMKVHVQVAVTKNSNRLAGHALVFFRKLDRAAEGVQEE